MVFTILQKLASAPTSHQRNIDVNMSTTSVNLSTKSWYSAYHSLKVAQQLMKTPEDRHIQSENITVGDEDLSRVLKFDIHVFSSMYKLM